MPCTDSSSGLNIYLDQNDLFKRYEFAKITCSSEIDLDDRFCNYCQGKDLEEILHSDFAMLVSFFGMNNDEESQFVLYLHWDALRCCIAKYLGKNDPLIDSERTQISSIDQTAEGFVISFVILPPAEMPKIVSCAKQES